MKKILIFTVQTNEDEIDVLKFWDTIDAIVLPNILLFWMVELIYIWKLSGIHKVRTNVDKDKLNHFHNLCILFLFIESWKTL